MQKSASKLQKMKYLANYLYFTEPEAQNPQLCVCLLFIAKSLTDPLPRRTGTSVDWSNLKSTLVTHPTILVVL